MLQTKRRFLVAGLIPFFCIFSQTLLQYNAMFALGGMVSILFCQCNGICTFLFLYIFVCDLAYLLTNLDFVQVNHTLADWETLEEWEVSIFDQQPSQSNL